MKTQFRSIISAPKRSTKNECFVDIHKAKYKWIPGPGTFKNVDNHAKTLNKDKAFMKPSMLMK